MKMKYVYIAFFLTFSGMVIFPNVLQAQELNCDDDDDDDGNDDDDGDDIDIPVVHAFDPNDITGPIGYDSLRWVSHQDVMGYTVRFENDPNFATAPAQKVTIHHPIDDEMDLFSFRVGEFGFGNHLFSVPPNSVFYNKRLDLRDSLDIYVDVTIGIDVNSRDAFWIFQSIDPATGLAGTLPANVGFLPVNDTAINRFNNFATQKGEGFVTFSLQPHKQVQTGDTASADASIVFDINAPIPTNIWTNIIDAKGPTSAIDPIPAVLDTTFVLSCTAVDDPGGVGVASYSIYVSEDGDPFYRIASDIPIDSSFVFQGKSGTNYCMYSLGKDWVGNVEKVKTQPDNCVFRQVKGDLVLDSPNGGELLCPEDTLFISWQYDLIPEVDILYSPDSGAHFFPLADNLPSDEGSFSWPLPDSLLPGTTYLLRIQNSLTGTLIDTSDAVFTLLPGPSKPAITASGPLAFCEMDQVSLMAQAGFSKYFWSTGDTSLSIQVDTTGRFSLQIIDANGCLSPLSDTIRTTRFALPAQPAIVANGPTTFCEGDSVQLRAPSGFAQYLWSNGATDSVNTLLLTDTLTVQVTDANGCESPFSLPTIVTAHALPPTPVITAHGALSFCEGDSVQLEAPAGYAGYSWSNGITDSLQYISSTTSLTLTVLGSNGCESAASAPLAISANPLPPQPTILANGATSFCDGDSVQLKAPAGYAGYAWSNGATDSLNSIFVSDTLVVSLTDANGCESPLSAPLIVQLNPLPAQPAILAQGPTRFCLGDSVQLKTASGYAAYHWSNGLSDSVITLFVSDTLSVSVVDANGCTSPQSASLIVTAHPLPAQPALLASGPTSFCEGDSVQLYVSGRYADYQWSNGVRGDSALWVFASDSLTLFVTDQNGCESPVSAAAIVTENPNPAQPTILASGPTAFCEGDSVELQGPGGFAMYKWSNGAGSASITVSMTDTLRLSVVDANGCESPLSAARTVLQNPLPPQPMILAGGPLTFCEGDSVQLQAPAGFAAYRWADGDTGAMRTIRLSGSYALTVVDSNACESPLSDPAVVTALAVPAQPMIIQLSADSLTSSVMGTAYQWFLNGNILPDTTQSIFIRQDGSYTVIVFNGPCASAESDSLSTPLQELLPAGSIQIYPNPNDGMFVIRGQFGRSSLLEFTLYNQLGQEIFRKELYAPQGLLYEVIQINKLADGIYIAQLRLNNRFSYKKIEVRK